MWQDGIGKRRARYLYLLKDSEIFYDTAQRCIEELSPEVLSKRDTVIRDVSLCVLAPAMNAYIIWVLKAALKKRIGRLYFLARDGYFMYTTARMLCERLHLPVECRYLSCSRYSIRIPMFHLNMSEALDYIVRGGIDVTLDKVLNRAGLSAEDKANVIRDIGTEFAGGVIRYADLGKLRTRLEASDVFVKAVKERSEAAFPMVHDYLSEEGLFDNVNYAFVDSGWTGSMQKVLGQLLSACGHGRSLHGFYWGLYELPADVHPEAYECFYFGPTFGVRRKIGFSNCLFESIFSAPHGMTLGYEKKLGRTVPVYAEIREDNKKFNELTERYLDEFTRALVKVFEEDEASEGILDRVVSGKKSPLGRLGRNWQTKSNLDTVRSLLDTFMGEPARHEAAVYGSLPFSDDVLDENEQQVAAPMTGEELETNHPVKKILILTGASKKHIRESAWFEGSAVRNGKDVERHLRAYRIYKWLLYGKKAVVRLKPDRGRFSVWF